MMLSAALASGDRELALRLAHTLNGVSGNIGATELQENAAKLEATIKESVDSNPVELVAQTGAELGRIIELIGCIPGREIASVPMGKREIPDNLQENLHLLLDKLENYDSAAEEVLSDILVTVEGTAVSDMLTGIKRDIEKYDMEAAANGLRLVIEKIPGLAGS